MIEITVVTPMHNEELCVAEWYRRLKATLDGMGDSYEIVPVSDGSTDRTNEMLRELAANDSHIRAIFLSRNIGQWAATAAGFRQSRGRWVIIMDADLQHEPEEIPRLVAESRKGFDLVSGSRGKRHEGALRQIPSWIANALMRITTKCPIRDMGGFKCLRGDVARKLRLRAGQHRLLPALLYLQGGAVSEVIVKAPLRFAGKSHYGLSRSIDVLFDIIMLWLESANKSRPLYLFGRLSLLSFLVAVGAMLWLMFDKAAFGEPISSRPPFYIALLMLGLSFGMLALGFILEMTSDLLNRLSDRDPYMIREIVDGRGGDNPT